MIGPGILVRMRITQAMSTKRNVHLHFLFPPHLVRVCYETSKEAYVYRLFDIFISLTPGMPFRSSIPISLYYILSILRGNYIRTSPGPFHLFISLFHFFYYPISWIEQIVLLSFRLFIASSFFGVGISLDAAQGRNKQAVFSGKHQMVYLHHSVVVHTMNKLIFGLARSNIT